MCARLGGNAGRAFGGCLRAPLLGLIKLREPCIERAHLVVEVRVRVRVSVRVRGRFAMVSAGIMHSS